jgi:hypothetical protein
MERRSVMSVVGLASSAIGCLTGCATIRVAEARSTGALLTAAGFEKQCIDAVAIERVDVTPPYRVVSRTRNGALQYSYADPEGCRCVYIGGAKEYAQYRRLAVERRLDEERWRAAEDAWDRDSWGPWD